MRSSDLCQRTLHYIISHRITLDQAPEMYKVWRDKKEQVTKIVIDPWAAEAA